MIVVFTTQYVELLLKRLGQFGVGQQHGTISIFPTSLQRHAKAKRSASKNGKESPETQRGGLGDDANRQCRQEVDATFVSEFVDSINSRVIVEEVIENVRSAAIFTFDYLMLVLVASMIAGVGLAVNSTVSIVASMLVSPIMGPILAITFGMTTKKYDLIMIGIRSELISLFLCILVGFIISLVFTAVGGQLRMNGQRRKWLVGQANGDFRKCLHRTAKYVTLYFALEHVYSNSFPSTNIYFNSWNFLGGIGVALSVLGNNTSSLVGVAISASPASTSSKHWNATWICNAGLLRCHS